MVKRLTADDWARAALGALRSGGVRAVTVEGLAATLGTTKGSAYWHHGSREALLQAALDYWERTETEDVVRYVELIEDPVRRLRSLLRLAIGDPDSADIDLAATGAGGHEAVRATVERVTRRRLAVLARCYRQLGRAPALAQREALTAYATYLGLEQLRILTPDAVPTGRGLERYLNELTLALVPPPKG